MINHGRRNLSSFKAGGDLLLDFFFFALFEAPLHHSCTFALRSPAWENSLALYSGVNIPDRSLINSPPFRIWKRVKETGSSPFLGNMTRQLYLC